MAEVRGKLVGIGYYSPRFPATPDDPIWLVREPHTCDPHTIQVWTRVDSAWAQLGYVDRVTAASLTAHQLVTARLITAGNGHTIPMVIRVVGWGRACAV